VPVRNPRRLGASRGHRKRAKTRAQLVEAGLAVLARKGEGLTVSDVAAAADVSGGTFYNYFVGRDELVDALAEHSLLALAEGAAVATADADPAVRFAVATARVLARAQQDPTWGRVVMRLVDLRARVGEGVTRYLEGDLAAGLAEGRFAVGPDVVTLDQMVGLILMGIRRIVAGKAPPAYPGAVIARALGVLGVPGAEADAIARSAAARGASRVR
jgi:AcrR family transcriptional regulator